MSNHTSQVKKTILEAEALEMELCTRASSYKAKLIKLKILFDEQMKLVEKQIAEQEELLKEKSKITTSGVDMKKFNLLCSINGHKLGDVVPVHCNDGVIYKARCCDRCDRRFPIDAENAAIKERVDAYIGSVMNASRAQYGLKPLDWSM